MTTLESTRLHRNAVKSDAVKNDTVKNDTVKHDAVKHDAVKHNAVKHDADSHPGDYYDNAGYERMHHNAAHHIRARSTVELVQLHEGLWRVIRTGGAVLGYVEEFPQPDGMRYRAKRLLVAQRRFMVIGEFWEMDNAIDCFESD